MRERDLCPGHVLIFKELLCARLCYHQSAQDLPLIGISPSWFYTREGWAWGGSSDPGGEAGLKEAANSLVANPHSSLPLRHTPFTFTPSSKAGVAKPILRMGKLMCRWSVAGMTLKPGWSSSKCLSHSLRLRALCSVSETWGYALLAMLETNKKMWLCAVFCSSLQWMNWKCHKTTSKLSKNKVIPGTNPKGAINACSP